MSFRDSCANCGKCCKAIPCGISLAMLGDSEKCEALEIHQDKFYCGLVLHASQYIDFGDYAEWKDEFLSRLFSHMLGIGMGCCSSPEGKQINKRLKRAFSDSLKFAFNEMTTGEAVDDEWRVGISAKFRL